MDGNGYYHYGIVGDGPDATIAAYGKSVAMGVPNENEQQKAWTCQICTFHNSESLGRFCSMCGSARFGNNESHNESQSSFSCSNEYEDTFGELASLPKESKSPPRSPKGMKQNDYALEGSFSLLNLVGSPSLEDVPETKEAGPAPPMPPSELNDKDFQMSFANWSISDNGAWTCSVCTFVNTNALHLTCEVCGGNRPSKKTGHECQKQMQNMFEMSFRTGQTDFLRRQQEKIEEIEERVIATERYDEITELQSNIMDSFQEQPNNGDNSNHSGRPSRAQLEEEYKKSEEYIAQLEEVRQKERREQLKMEAVLETKRRDLGIERTATMRALINPTPSNSAMARSDEAKVRAQEKLLSQWKTNWKAKEPDIAAIRKRQQAILEKWQHGP